ncbi:hypothetical protein OOZ19_02495 [Saccharopolyspora sp. NFXS83]|uniref:hypothetical protein n=1 Tax=Saccharopolyspora sp. NFXS83 TaxID=2993560 RepID=UPI00224ADD97|nr:hypothetical protein [Saccharopolyspora sp. NFXS83]MCX2729100.1 hypothetical protein [Saccharopolyspora sp. NFXS83]
MNNSPVTDVDRVRRALVHGRAAVLPNPAPLTYVVASTNPRVANEAKGRPADQAVALWAHHPRTVDTVFEALDLTPEAATAARRLLTEERVTFLAPRRADHSPPAWLEPASSNGWTMLFGARWEPLLPVIGEHPVLYVSSANRTGHRPVSSACQAREMFAAEVPVLDPASLPGSGGGEEPRLAATTTVRLQSDGTIGLHRNGAQDSKYPSPAAYLDHLRDSYGFAVDRSATVARV